MALRTRTASYRFSLPARNRLRWLKGSIEVTCSLGINEVVIDVEPILGIGNNPGLAQDAQLLRDVRLRLVLHRLQVADAFGVAPHVIEDLQAHPEIKQFESIGLDLEGLRVA